MRWLALLLCLSPSEAQENAGDILKEAVKLNQQGDRAATRRALEQTIELAVKQNDRDIEAEARFQLGVALNKMAQYEASSIQLNVALPYFEKSPNREALARIYGNLGGDAYFLGKSA